MKNSLKTEYWAKVIPYVLLLSTSAAYPSVAPGGPTVTEIAGGLKAAIGEAYQASDNSLYFVQWVSGDLSKLNLTTHAVTNISTGYSNPQDVALVPGTSTAYVTTRDGQLWQAATNSSVKVSIANGLGMPHQLAIDTATWHAYMVDFSGGNLWKVDLRTGAKEAVVSGLSNPIGLLMSTDFKTAYVAEANQIVAINLGSVGSRTTLVTGLTNAFFMSWANEAHSAIYFVERDPANRVSRLDLGTIPATHTLIATVPFRPSAVVPSVDPSTLYVACDSEIVKVSLAAGVGGPVITRLGQIPSTSVNFSTGQATTDPAYFFYVKNAAFGGSVHMMLNYPGIRSSGGAYYKVLLDGASPANPEKESWTNYKWNGSTFVLETVLPDPAGFYTVPSASDVWAIPDLGFALNTGKYSNARHVVEVQLYNSAHAPISGGTAQVAVLVDNNSPTFRIEQITHDGAPLNQCALITSGSPSLQFTFTAWDPEGHLFNYSLVDQWGHGNSYQITEDHYVGVHDGAPVWTGVSSKVVSFNLSLTSTACAHSFYLGGYGNVTNGYGFTQYGSDFDTVAIYLGGHGLCLPQ